MLSYLIPPFEMSSPVVLPSFTVNPLFNLAYTVSKIEQKKKTTHLLSDKK